MELINSGKIFSSLNERNDKDSVWENSDGRQTSDENRKEIKESEKISRNSTITENELQTASDAADVSENEATKKKSSDDESPYDKIPNKTKKKSKRRGLFNRKKKSSVKNAKVNSNSKEDGRNVETWDSRGFSMATKTTTTNDDQQVAVKEAMITAEELGQSDVEVYYSVGELSEADGKDEELSSTGRKRKTRKSFFKRSLSLKRRKAKKHVNKAEEHEKNEKQENCTYEYSEEDNVFADNKDAPRDKEDDKNGENKDLGVNDDKNGENEDLGVNDDKNGENQDLAGEGEKEDGVKIQKRKVSFVDANGTKLESSSDLSQTDPPVDDSDDETVTTEANTNDPHDAPYTSTENANLKNIIATSGEDDELTEVSSMTSELLASSDAYETISTSDTSRLLMFTDTEETGSRITLEGISEESVYDMYEERKTIHGDVVEATLEKTECDGNILHKDTHKDTLEEKESVDNSETTKLQSEKRDTSKVEEWQQFSKSCEMSIELSRVRKHTMFGVKRLCCVLM